MVSRVTVSGAEGEGDGMGSLDAWDGIGIVEPMLLADILGFAEDKNAAEDKEIAWVFSTKESSLSPRERTDSTFCDIIFCLGGAR